MTFMNYAIGVTTICALLILINQIMLYFSKKTKEEEKNRILSQIFNQIFILLLLYFLYTKKN